MENILVSIYDIFLYNPLVNLLVIIYENFPIKDFGIAIIILTLLIKFIFFPLTQKSIQSQKELKKIQPKIDEIKEKYKDDKVKQSQALMELFRKEKVNPMSGCLPILVQIPVLIAVYRVFWQGVDQEKLVPHLYNFVHITGSINYNFLGLVDLSNPSVPLAITTGILQYFQAKMVTPKASLKEKDPIKKMQYQMMFFLPLITIIILITLPSALALYWLVSTLFTIFQQYIIFRK
ncbi:Membrane protein insertase YidC 2 [bacterium HR34]|nr:Membrane protein insertase YidC 2 [bacterium HR34]